MYKKIISFGLAALMGLSIGNSFVEADQNDEVVDETAAFEVNVPKATYFSSENQYSNSSNDTWNQDRLKKNSIAAVTSFRASVYTFSTQKNSMIPIAGKKFLKDSLWRTDIKKVSSQDGSIYYRVSTNEYLKSNDVNIRVGQANDPVNSMKGTAVVTWRTGYKVSVYSQPNGQLTNKKLPQSSTWKIYQTTKINGKNWYKVGNNQWINQDHIVVINSNYPATVHLNVPLISQNPELPNGCEITAVTMMLNYSGAKVNKMQLAREMPRSGNPNYGYIGNPWDNTGITIFPSALMGLVEKYSGTHTAKNLTGQSFDAIKYELSIGHPVTTWHTMNGFPYHALAVSGYDSQYVYFNDCWTYKRAKMRINTFINNWQTQSRRAIGY